MKTCSRCKLDKLASEFNSRTSSKDGLQPVCRSCQRAWYRNYYESSPTEKARLALRRKIDYAKKQRLLQKAKSIPCADCGVSYPTYVMDFDHRDRKSKLFNTGRIANYGVEKLKAEIDKCDVVCSNCHRIRTWDE